MKSTGAKHSVLYGFYAPWSLQLEGIVDAMLTAALNGHRAPPLNRVPYARLSCSELNYFELRDLPLQ